MYFSDVRIVCSTLHLTVPHPPACPTYREHSDINSYFKNWNLGCAKVKLRGDHCQSHIEFQVPAVNTLKALFSSVSSNWDAVWSLVNGHMFQCPPLHEMNTNGPGQSMANEKTASQVLGPISGWLESMEMLGCLCTYFDRTVTTVTPLQLTFVLGYVMHWRLCTSQPRPEHKNNMNLLILFQHIFISASDCFFKSLLRRDLKWNKLQNFSYFVMDNKILSPCHPS